MGFSILKVCGKFDLYPNLPVMQEMYDSKTALLLVNTGGCYAKTINLSEKTEPDIYRAIHTDALLENVKISDDMAPDYFDTTKTENGRVSYPIFHIPGYVSFQVTCSTRNYNF